MGKTRNLFALTVGRYTNSAAQQRIQFLMAKDVWQDAATEIRYA
ncbi:hypothetical protein LDG_5833 [Legionella drancourtii LLAP12]|uniref:Uncharacterized protein n=1 Tax=Legionella drancourtii LLAP12 TaxID=658187 RepID=G9EKU2_9GAMM|nr:hypothetical protein LDG_5833 [Legionella drancourtii LLAP12]